MRVITECEIYEVSLVAHPANPNCRIFSVGGRVIEREG